MTAPVTHLSYSDGPTQTVNSLMKDPTWIPRMVLDMMRDQFLGDALLRKGPAAQSGAVVWREAAPLFSPTEQEIIAEYAEIPGGENVQGGMYAAHTTKRGLAVKVSQEMRDRNDVAVVRDYMEQVSNTIVRGWDRVFFNALLTHPTVQVLESAAGWGNTPLSTSPAAVAGTSVRKDIASAIYRIASAFHGTDPDNKYAYNADTLIVGHDTVAQFLDNDEVNSIFTGSDLASENLRYTGKMPRKFFSLDVVTSWQVPSNTAIVMQRGKTGFISDERPLRATPMYEDRPRETWRADFTRSSVVCIDNPKSAVIITNLNK